MSLQHYLRKAYAEARLASHVSSAEYCNLTGTLRTGQQNLILVYGGSFNPPHRGHIEVLLSGLRPEVEAVAIVVLPSEDFHLRHKMSNSRSRFFLSRERRADIWRALPNIPREKVWVWTETWYPFQVFMHTMVQSATRDGFELAFSHLIGPDNLNTERPLAILPYELPVVLVTDKARSVAAHFSPDGKPVAWCGFSDWSRCLIEQTDGEQNGGLLKVVLWKCESKEDAAAKSKGYYLHFEKGAPVDMNSTELRDSLTRKKLPDEATLNQLSTRHLLQILAPMLQDA